MTTKPTRADALAAVERYGREEWDAGHDHALHVAYDINRTEEPAKDALIAIIEALTPEWEEQPYPAPVEFEDEEFYDHD